MLAKYQVVGVSLLFSAGASTSISTTPHRIDKKPACLLEPLKILQEIDPVEPLELAFFIRIY